MAAHAISKQETRIVLLIASEVKKTNHTLAKSRDPNIAALSSGRDAQVTHWVHRSVPLNQKSC